MGSCTIKGIQKTKTRNRVGQLEKCSLCKIYLVTSTDQHFLTLLFQELCIRNNSKKSLEKSIFLLFAPIPVRVIQGLLGERVFDYHDTDRDGYLDLDQFLSVIEKFSKSIDTDLSSEIFEMTDLKGDGVIDKEELRQTVRITQFYALLNEVILQNKSPVVKKKSCRFSFNFGKSEGLNFSTSTMTTFNDGLFRNKDTADEIVDAVFEKFAGDSLHLQKNEFQNFLNTQSWFFAKFKEWFHVKSWANGTQLKVNLSKKNSNPFVFSAKVFCKGRLSKVYLQIKDSFLLVCNEKKVIQEVFFIEGCQFKYEATSLYLIYNTHLEERANFELDSEAETQQLYLCLTYASNSRKFKDFYTIQDKIGSGKFSNVFTCKESSSGECWAVKVIKKHKMDRAEREMIRNEVKIIKSCPNFGVIKFREVFESHRSVKIVMELVTGGDLLHKITNEQADEETIKQVIKQILTNVKSLHDLGIIHRDLKPENIMVDKENQEIKFIDFGLSTFCLPLEMKKYKCGTLGYMAPEVLTGAYSKKVDIWSVGVITFAYLTGKLPFYSHSKEEILEMTQNCEPDFLSEKWMNYSEEAKSFTQALLMKSPLDRPNVEEALNHSWLKG